MPQHIEANILFPYYMGVPVQTTDRYDPGHEFISFSLSKSANTAFHFFIIPQPFHPLYCLQTVFLSQDLFSLPTHLKLSIPFPTPSGPCMLSTSDLHSEWIC